MAKHKIYKHTNLINGKVYIGQTSVNLNSRWRKGEGYKGSPHFYAAIQKYGWDNFSHEILAETDSIDFANILEKEYIKKYNSTNDKYGYNILPGGRGHTHSLEEKYQLHLIMKEKWKDPIFRQKMEKSQNKNRNMQYCSRKIYCVETNKVFNSQQEAARFVGLKSSAGINKCCFGERKTAGGYHWKFHKEVNYE